MAVFDLMQCYKRYIKWFTVTDDLFSSGLSSSNILFAKCNAANFFVKSCCTAVLPREQKQQASPTTSLLTLNCAGGALANNTSFTVATQEHVRVAGLVFLMKHTSTIPLGRRR